MHKRPLGQSGIMASVVGCGTWAIGGWCWGGADDAASIKAIHAAIDAGINLIDTAPAYGFGRAEEIVGQAIHGRRDKVVIASKCGLIWGEEKGEHFFDSDAETYEATNPDRRVFRYLGPESIRREVDASLRRLGVETIDLMQTHWQDSTTPIEATMDCLLDLKRQGKIRAIGVCNATVEQLKQYQSRGPVTVDQEKYGMLDRGLENDLIPHCHKTGVAVLAYSPLAMGLLTGKVTASRAFGAGDVRANDPRFSIDNRVKVAAMLDEFRPVADRRGLTLAQLVIAWTVAQRGVTHALVGARDTKQAAENAAAGAVTLDAGELRTLSDALSRHAAALA